MGNLMTQTSGNDSLETYSIFWLDASAHNEENIKAQKKLRSIVNQLRTFVDPEEFLDGVRLIQQGDLTILIVSGQMGRIVVPEMQKLAQVSSIYVYCFDKEANLQWSQPYKKVKAVCTKLDELIDIIRVDQKNRGRNEEALAMDILDRSSTELNEYTMCNTEMNSCHHMTLYDDCADSAQRKLDDVVFLTVKCCIYYEYVLNASTNETSSNKISQLIDSCCIPS
ncbi:unnamed protein product [Rotaria magnacalcarata]